MSETDELLRAELDRAYPRAAPAPDWEEVLRRVAPPAGRPGRGRWAAGAAALAAAAAVVVALGAPWRGGASFAQRALAALGTDRYVVAVVEPERSYQSVVELATGKERPAAVRTTYLFDSGSTETIPTLSFWETVDGVTIGSSGQGSPTDEPGLAAFVGGYRKALRDGSAKVVGETTAGGRRARIVRFGFDYAMFFARPGLATRVRFPGGATEDVAVDAATYRPLWVDRTETVIRGDGAARRVVRYHEPRYRIVSIRSVSRPPARPAAPPGRGVGYARPALRAVSRSTAPLALGPRAAWPGPSVGALPFRSLRLEQLWRFGAGAAAGLGLHLVYGDGRRTVHVRESTRPQPAYGFVDDGLLPPPGTLRLSCYGCGVGNWPARETFWRGQLRDGRLYVGLEAPTRELLLAAARSLRPMR